MLHLHDVGPSLLLRCDSALRIILLHSRLDRSNILEKVQDTIFAWQRRSLAAGGKQPTASAFTLRPRAFGLFAWHTRRRCDSQRWLERPRALDCTYNDAITHRRHHDLPFLGFSRFIDTIGPRLDGSGCAGTQIPSEGL